MSVRPAAINKEQTLRHAFFRHYHFVNINHESACCVFYSSCISVLCSFCCLCCDMWSVCRLIHVPLESVFLHLKIEDAKKHAQIALWIFVTQRHFHHLKYIKYSKCFTAAIINALLLRCFAQSVLFKFASQGAADSQIFHAMINQILMIHLHRILDSTQIEFFTLLANYSSALMNEWIDLQIMLSKSKWWKAGREYWWRELFWII